MADHPWLKSYPEGVDWRADMPPRLLHDLMEDAAIKYGNRTFIHFLGRKLSFRAIAQRVERAAVGLQKIGVGKGVRVGVCMPNCPQYVVSLFAISRAGGTVVNFSPLYSEQELRHQARDSGVSVMITVDLDLTYTKIRDILSDTGIETLVVADFADSLPFPQNILFRIFKRRQIARLRWDERHRRFRDLLKAEGGWQKPELDPEADVAMLQYTGGTTGVPKGAMLTHANLTVNAQQSVAAFRDLRDGQEIIHGVLPFFHIFALIAVGFVSVLKGATIVMQPRFKLEDVLDDLERRDVTLLPAVPTMLTAINHAIEAKPRRFQHLKLVVSGGASLPVEVARKWMKLTGVDIREGYGLTEASPVVALTPAGGGKEGSIGLPLPGTIVSIVDVDDAAKPMPMGEQGELAVEGPQVMKGYWMRPEETAEVMHGRQLLTGDIGVMDEDGYVFIVDRKKETIKVSGYNVFPRAIEEAIYEHPAVKEAAVIGVPDAYRGETPKCFVVLNDGARLTADELLAFLKQRIGKHEMPEFVEFRTDLPKSPIGKILKKELVAQEKTAEGGSA